MACENHAEMNGKHTEHDRKIEALSARVARLEQDAARSDEKIDRIFDDIDAIKIILRDIQISLSHLQQKPGQRWEIVVKALLVGGAGYFLAQLIK
jgi:predicted nuclease with TOPRIM domain